MRTKFRYSLNLCTRKQRLMASTLSGVTQHLLLKPCQNLYLPLSNTNIYVLATISWGMSRAMGVEWCKEEKFLKETLQFNVCKYLGQSWSGKVIAGAGRKDCNPIPSGSTMLRLHCVTNMQKRISTLLPRSCPQREQGHMGATVRETVDSLREI